MFVNFNDDRLELANAARSHEENEYNCTKICLYKKQHCEKNSYWRNSRERENSGRQLDELSRQKLRESQPTMKVISRLKSVN